MTRIRTILTLTLALLAGTGIGAGTAAQGATRGNSPHTSTVTLTKQWTGNITPIADSAAAYAAHSAARGGPTIYLLAGNNESNCQGSNPVHKATLYALNAADGSVRWTRSTTGPSRCTTAGPVVDSAGHWVYAPGLDGKLHRYNAATGQETVSAPWPIAVTLMPNVEKISATPTIHGHYLYVSTSGFIGDAGHYQGHLVTVDLTRGTSSVFNSLCSNIRRLLGLDSGKSNYCPQERSGLFGRGQGTIDPVSHDVYIVSGNGAWNGRTNWGDSIVRLNPAGTKILDSFTPSNQQALDDGDLDLGSTGPAMLPTVKIAGHPYHLLTQGGKGPACDSCHGAAIRLLNRDDLSGKHGPGHVGGDLSDARAPGGCEVLTAPAIWHSPSKASWVFYANDYGVAGYRVDRTGSHWRLTRVWSSRSGGTTPVLHDGLLYVASSGHITVYDPASGKVVATATGIGSVHWEYPTVAGNHLYMSDGSGNVHCIPHPLNY